MSKLKKLSDEDLDIISYNFGEILEKEVFKVISSKELQDFDLDIIINYENEQLDVDVDLGVHFDELSDINQELLIQAVDESYLQFDSYIDNNFIE